MNIPPVVLKTISLKHGSLLFALLMLGVISANAQDKASTTDWQQRIDYIENHSGLTPWKWATKLSHQWIGQRSSQNRPLNTVTTSPSFSSSPKAITANYKLNNNQLTLAADFGRMLHTQIQVDEQTFTGSLEPAGFDTLTTYPFAGLPNHTEIICKWSVSGKTFRGKLTSPMALARWMNRCEANGNWKLNFPNQQIEGSKPEAACGTLEILVRATKEERKIDPVTQYPPKGTVLYLDEGVKCIKFQEPGNPKSESLVLTEPIKHSNKELLEFLPHNPVATFVQQTHRSFLFIQGLEKMPDHQLSIFNRWGREIYHTIKYQNNWDGKNRNKPVPEGTYYYVLNNGKGVTFSGCFNIRS